MKNKNEIKKFCEKYDITEKQFSGKEKISGYLDLSSLTSIPTGFNPTVGGYLDLSSLTSIPTGFNPTVGGSLDLSSLTSIPTGFYPTVGGDLDLRSLTSIPTGFNPTVGGDLYLRSLTSIPTGFNPTVGGSLDLRSLTSIPTGFNPTVGGDLDLSSLTSIPTGFNPTVGGYLDLRSLTSIPTGFNPTVGGYLDLSSLTSIPTGFNPTVGGDLILKNSRKHIRKPVLQIEAVQINKNFFWNKNDKRYAIIDRIFCELLTERKKIIGRETYKIFSAKKVNKDSYFFISNKENFYAHAEDLKKSFEDLKFKIASERIKKQPIKKDTIITMQHYRIITGACELGCKSWMEQNGISKEKIKASELLPILEKTNAYGLDRFKKLITF